MENPKPDPDPQMERLDQWRRHLRAFLAPDEKLERQFHREETLEHDENDDWTDAADQWQTEREENEETQPTERLSHYTGDRRTTDPGWDEVLKDIENYVHWEGQVFEEAVESTDPNDILHEISESAILISLLALRCTHHQFNQRAKYFLRRLSFQAVPALIEALDQHGIPLRYMSQWGHRISEVLRMEPRSSIEMCVDCLDVLRDITGQNFENNVVDWRNWWTTSPEGLRMKEECIRHASGGNARELADSYARIQFLNEAAECYREAAATGDRCAARELGLMYRDGKGILADKCLALQYFRMASGMGDDYAECEAAEAYAGMYQQFNGVETELVAEGIAESTAKAALSGDAEARLAIGQHFASVAERHRDHDINGFRARFWFEKASDAGNTTATFELAELHRDYRAAVALDGDPSDTGPPTALWLYIEAAERGHVQAMIEAADVLRDSVCYDGTDPAICYWLARAGVAYLEGKGVAQNTARGTQLYSDAMSSRRNAKGDIDVQQRGELIEFHRKFAETGNSDAMFELAKAFCDGDGIEMNMVESTRWLVKAAETGNTDAIAARQDLQERLSRDGE